MHTEASTSDNPAAPSASTPKASPGDVPSDGRPRIGPFEVLSTLGRGGMADVFVVEDPRPFQHGAPGAPRVEPGGASPARPGERLALKWLHAATPTGGVASEDSAVVRLRREFRALSRMQHPNVLAVREWGFHLDRPWIAMELVEGEDLRVLAARWATLDPEDRFARVQSMLVQTARALAYIHERGIVHRDVSPANIMVRRDGLVKLMDFGLATDRAADLTRVGEVMGTLAYAAPEQILGEKVDGRSDLYALGAVLYQVLTLRKPFTAHTPQGYLDCHLRESVRPPREIDPLVPDALDAVCMRLLQKAPADRFASANHLLHVLGDVEEEADHDAWPPRLVGRTPVKAWLRDSMDDIAAGRPGGALVLSGVSGSGKTRLLEFADQLARRRGLTVARGRCRTHDGPFGAFFSIFDALRAAATPEGGRWADDPVLVTAFDPDRADVRLERYPVIAAFHKLLTTRTPAVVLVDAIDKADAATREMVEYLLRNASELAPVPVVFVIAGEADDPTKLPVCSGARWLRRIHLEPLAPSEVEELVLSFVPPSPAALALAERLHTETDGSPAFLADMLRGLADEGVLVREGERYQLTLAPEEVSRSHLPLPDSLRAILAERLAPLTPLATTIGQVLALTRRGLELDLVIQAVDHAEDDVIAAVHELLDADVVVEDPGDGAERVELSHGRFRDLLAEPLDESTLRATHRRLGELLERRHRHAPFAVAEDLAWHFEQAGLPPKAYAWLGMTARKQLDRGLHEEGLYYLDVAVRMEPQARPYLLLDEADRLLARLHLDRLRALYHLGQWEEAVSAGAAAEACARDLRDGALSAEIAGERGRVFRNMSRMAEAEVQLRESLRFADEAGTPRLRMLPLYELAALQWSAGDMTAAEAMWTACMELARAQGDEAAEAFAWRGLGIIAFCQGRSADAVKHQNASAEIFERLGMLDPLAVTWVNLIELHILMGKLHRALRLADQTIAQSKELRHTHGLSMGLCWRARVLLMLGRHDDARRNAQEALNLAVGLDTKEEQISALRTMVQIQIASGQGRFALARVTHLLEMLAKVDPEDVLPHVRALQARCLALRGDVGAAREVLRGVDAARGLLHSRASTLLDLGLAWRDTGDLAAARASLEGALEIATRGKWELVAMAAHQELERVVPEAERGPHASRARSLARTVASSLERADGEDFLVRGAGAGVR